MWLEIGELTSEDRKYIAILGRALLVCQRVENNIKWFTQIVEFSAAWSDVSQADAKEIAVKTDKYQFRNRLDRLAKLAATGTPIAKDMSYFNETLEAALVSRNFIIHESVGLSALSPKYASEEEIKKDNATSYHGVKHKIPQRRDLLKRHLENVVLADNLLSIMSYQVETQDYYRVPYQVIDYQKRLLSWIMARRA